MVKFTINCDKLWCTWDTIGFGVLQVTCFAREHVCPVGLLWGHAVGKGNTGKTRIDVADIYVPKFARRQGVMTKIHKCLFTDFKASVVVTQNGSKEGGRAFLEAIGYRLDRKLGFWILTEAAMNQAIKK